MPTSNATSASSGKRPPKMAARRSSTDVYKYRNRRVYIPDGYLIIGQIVGAHGLRGEFKVELHTDFPDRFTSGDRIFLGDALQEVEIEHVRPRKNHLLMRFNGIIDRREAERLRGLWLYIPESEAVELEEDSYWVHDIVGLSVQTMSGQNLGIITDVMSTGANDVYIIQPADDVNRGKEILLPAIAGVVQTINLEAGQMAVELPPGLIDE